MTAQKFQPNCLKINLTSSARMGLAAGWGVIGLVALISLAGLAVAGPASSKAGSGGDLTGSAMEWRRLGGFCIWYQGEGTLPGPLQSRRRKWLSA